MLKPSTTTALAVLTFDVGNYESAWRKSTACATDEERREASKEMRKAAEGSDAFVKLLGEELGIEAALAIRGALTMAAARVHGVRPRHHINQQTCGEVRNFIREHVSEGI